MPSTLEKLDFIDIRSYDMKGCTKSLRDCLKFTFIFVNIPFVALGAISLGVGLWVMVSDVTFFDLTADILDLEVLDQDILRQGAIVMVTVGAFMLVLAGIGVIGALAMNSCILMLYLVPLVVLLTLEAAVIVLAVVFKSEWESRAHQLVAEDLIQQYGDSVDSGRGPFTRTFNTIQKKLDCCGWEGGWDYKKIDQTHWNTTLASGQHRQVPDSCCFSDNATWTLDCVLSPYNSTNFSFMGCRDAVEAQLRNFQWAVIGVSIAVISLQFFLVVLTLTLMVHNVSNKYDLR